jgi:hypothetical protein
VGQKDRCGGSSGLQKWFSVRLCFHGDHSYEGLKADWTGWSSLIATGGVVALHDSRSSSTRLIDDPGSVRFTSQKILSDPLFEVVELVDSLTVLRRRSNFSKT